MPGEDHLLVEKLVEFHDYFLGRTHVRTVARRVHHHQLAVWEPFVNIFSHARASYDIPLTLQYQRSCRADVESLLDALESNHVAWSATMAPAIMGNPDSPELAGELEASFCRMDPFLANHFARVTFLSDNRADLSKVKKRSGESMEASAPIIELTECPTK